MILTAALLLDMVPFVPTGLEVRADGYTSVGSFDALNQALNGTGNKYIKLTADITDTREDGVLQIEAGKHVDLDLNGHRLTVGWITIMGRLTISDKTGAHNGTVNSQGINCGDDYVVNQTEDNNLVLESGMLDVEAGISVMKNWKFLMTGGTVNGTVINYGTFTMTEGTVNTLDFMVDNEGIFTMSGGMISTDSRNAVHVNGNNAVFTLSGGKISGSTTTNEEGAVTVSNGANFVMDGGKICDSKSGGVYVYHATFTMNDGEISGNSKSIGSGGGVCADADSSFIMNGGKIAGNIAPGGAGVYAYNFTMNGGKICGNSAAGDGGGVLCDSFKMNGGEITGNTAGGNGGGLYGRFNGISGKPVIKDNVIGGAFIDGVLTGGTVNNWYALNTDVHVTGALAEGAYIGATKNNFIEWTNGKIVMKAAETYNGGKLTQTDVEAIVSDSGDFFIALNDEGKGVYMDGYPVSFDSDGGSSVANQYIFMGGKAERPERPVKENSLFENWYMAEDGELSGDPFNFDTEIEEPVTLKAKWAEVSVELEDWTYGDAANTPVINKPEGSGEVTYTYYTDENLSVKTVSDNGAEGGIPKRAGTYYLKAEIEESDDYGPGTLVKEFTVNPITIGIEWSNTAFTYDGNEKKPTAAATGLLEGDQCTLNVAGGRVNANAEGEHYTAGVESLSNHDYALPERGITQDFTIAKRDATIKAKDQTVTVNGSIESSVAQAEMSGAIEGDVLKEIKLTADSTAVVTDKGSITPSEAKIVNGEIDVTANYKISYETGVLKVIKGEEPRPEPEPEPEPVIGIQVMFDPESISMNAAGEYEAVYSGRDIKPEVIVKNNGKLLVRDSDYTLNYSENENAGNASVEIKGKDIFTFKETLKFMILARDIADEDVKLGNTVFKAGNDPAPVLSFAGEELKYGRDYTVAVQGNKVHITGKGNFAGERYAELTELDEEAYKASAIRVSMSKVSRVYNGEAHTLSASELIVKDAKGTQLTEGRDYLVSYSDNVNAGTVELCVVGCGSYSGKVIRSFKITPDKKASFTVTLDKNEYEFIKTGVKPELSVKLSNKGTLLKEGVDYKVTFSSNKKVGNGKFKLTFKGNYKGAKYKGSNSFKIVKEKASAENTTVVAGDMIYKKKAKYQPKVYVIVNGELLTKSDVNVTYSEKKKIEGPKDNLNVTVKCKGKKYDSASAEVSVSYNVVAAEGKTDISKATIKLMKNKTVVKSVGYTGREIVFDPADKDAPHLRLKVGVTLLSDEETAANFDVYYADNIEGTKMTVILKAKSSSKYAGAVSTTIKIGKQ